jgi:transposase InsO family protein
MNDLTSSTDPNYVFYSMAIDDRDLLDCFVNLPVSSGVPFVLDYKTIREAQVGDARLQTLRQKQPDSFVNQQLPHDLQLVCYIPAPNEPWKIFLPNTLLGQAVQWYHLALGHIGTNRLYGMMKQYPYHPDLRNQVDDFVSRCKDFQIQKSSTRGHRLLAPRQAEAHHWREVAVDLIGPWKLEISNVQVSFVALTIIDTTTNLVELVSIDNKSAAYIARKFEQTWLARYPMPKTCVHDQGGEFIGYPFQNMLRQHGIKSHATTAKNPQANALCERMHQTVGNTLRALHSMQPPDGIDSATQLVDMALANGLFATRATVHSGLQASPGSLAFA